MRRVYDKSVKGYVYHLSGGPGHKLALPKDPAKDRGLGLTQPFVVFQVFVPEGHHASFEIQFSDERGTRRRLLMSTSFVETKPSPLHCQVPLSPSALPPERWTQLAVHVPSMAQALFSDNSASQGTAGFRAVEHVGVGAHCKLRRVFTLRAAPEGDETFAGPFSWGEDGVEQQSQVQNPAVEPVPRAVDFPKDVPHKVSVLMPSRLRLSAGKRSSRERGLGSRERARSRGSSREGAMSHQSTPRGFAASDFAPGSPHARAGGHRGFSRDGGSLSRRGSMDADGRPRAPAGLNERWGFDALATSSGDSDSLAPEGWQIAFGSRVSTPARGSRPNSRAKESASREQQSRGEPRANARIAGDGDGRKSERARERGRLSLSASFARGLSFDDEESASESRAASLESGGLASPSKARNAAMSTSRKEALARGLAPDAADPERTAPPAASDFGGWDFMRDGVPTRGIPRAPAPARDANDKADTRAHTNEPVASARPAYDARRYFPDDEETDGVAFVDGDSTRSGDAAGDDSGGWGALRPRRMAGYGRSETPASVTGRPPSGDSSALLGRDSRLYTPELVVVSDRCEGGTEGERGEKVSREDDVEAGVGEKTSDGEKPSRVSVSASSDSSTAEKENETAFAVDERRGGKERGEALAEELDPERTKPAADRVADLDLVYDPMLDFYYDPRNGKYYELA